MRTCLICIFEVPILSFRDNKWLLRYSERHISNRYFTFHELSRLKTFLSGISQSDSLGRRKYFSLHSSLRCGNCVNIGMSNLCPSTIFGTAPMKAILLVLRERSVLEE